MPRNTRLSLSLATASLIPLIPSFATFREGEGDKGAGGAGDKPKPADKKDAPAKIELTQEELDARITAAAEAALKKERETAAEKAQREKEEAERKKAEEQGEFKKLADAAEEKRAKAESERDAAKLAAKSLEVKDQLRDYLAEKHPEYVAVAKYIMPLVTFDLATEAKDVAKRITEAADQYVKDNPRKTGAATTPGNPPRNTIQQPSRKPEEPSNGYEYSHVARRAF